MCCDLCALTDGELQDIREHNRAAKRLGISGMDAADVRRKRETAQHRKWTYDEILSQAISDLAEDKTDGFTFARFVRQK